jgi:hypothetical protein
LTGAFIGVLSEAVNRKRIVVGAPGPNSTQFRLGRCARPVRRTPALACGRRRSH